MRQQPRGLRSGSWGIVVLLVPVLLLAASCAAKSHKTQLHLQSTTMILPPELSELKVTRNGVPVGETDRVRPGDQLVVELAGTRNVAGVVEHGDHVERLSDAGGGRYSARIQVPAGAQGTYRIGAWLNDPQATPQDSARRSLALSVEPPAPPPPAVDPLVERKRQARAELDRKPPVYFARNSDKMIGAYAETLDHWAAVVKQYSDLEFVIYGAASEEGEEYYNSVLGLQRTVQVRKGLIERGADNRRLGVNSLGRSRAQHCADKPAAEQEACRAKDRWVHLEPAGYDPEIDTP